jgi:putative membrane protein
LARRLRLASVHVDTAGGIRLVGHHREEAEAYALAATLASRSRAARQRDRDLSIKYD